MFLPVHPELQKFFPGGDSGDTVRSCSRKKRNQFQTYMIILVLELSLDVKSATEYGAAAADRLSCFPIL